MYQSVYVEPVSNICYAGNFVLAKIIYPEQNVDWKTFISWSGLDKEIVFEIQEWNTCKIINLTQDNLVLSPEMYIGKVIQHRNLEDEKLYFFQEQELGEISLCKKVVDNKYLQKKFPETLFQLEVGEYLEIENPDSLTLIHIIRYK